VPSAVQHDVFAFGADIAQTLFDVIIEQLPSSPPRGSPRSSRAARRGAEQRLT
jgi:hypothetical protein